MLFRPDGARPLVFRWIIPDSWRARMKERKMQIEVYEAAAAVVAVHTFAPYIAASDVFFFVDNTGAQAALTHGVGGADDVNAIASAFWTQAAAEDLGIWVERVDSESNPADLPSRGLHCDFLAQLGARDLPIVRPTISYFA